MIGIINTGLGNIPSISSALEKLDCNFILCSNKNDLDRVNKIILPGVGSFKSFHEKIQNNNMFHLIHERVRNGTPILGICLGFHALFEKSMENEYTNYFKKLQEASKYASNLGLEVHAGHGLTVNSVKYLRELPEIKELNIGHAIVSDSIVLGLASAVKRMKEMINIGRG